MTILEVQTLRRSRLGCYQTDADPTPFTHRPPSASGRPFAPGYLAEAEQEQFPDHPRQLVLGDGDEPERFVETDQLHGRMHVQLFMPAGVDFVPARRARQAPRPRNSSRVKTPSIFTIISKKLQTFWVYVALPARQTGESPCKVAPYHHGTSSLPE